MVMRVMTVRGVPTIFSLFLEQADGATHISNFMLSLAKCLLDRRRNPMYIHVNIPLSFLNECYLTVNILQRIEHSSVFLNMNAIFCDSGIVSECDM